jgi:hypothetical protein
VRVHRCPDPRSCGIFEDQYRPQPSGRVRVRMAKDVERSFCVADRQLERVACLDVGHGDRYVTIARVPQQTDCG